jgi:hypothetical protein
MEQAFKRGSWYLPLTLPFFYSDILYFVLFIFG